MRGIEAMIKKTFMDGLRELKADPYMVGQIVGVAVWTFFGFFVVLGIVRSLIFLIGGK